MQSQYGKGNGKARDDMNRARGQDGPTGCNRTREDIFGKETHRRPGCDAYVGELSTQVNAFYETLARGGDAQVAP